MECLNQIQVRNAANLRLKEEGFLINAALRITADYYDSEILDIKKGLFPSSMTIA